MANAYVQDRSRRTEGILPSPGTHQEFLHFNRKDFV